MAGAALRLAVMTFCLSLLPCAASIAQGPCEGVSPAGNATLKAVSVVTGLSGRPLYVTAAPGDVDRVFIVEQDGPIWIKKRGTDPATRQLFLDLGAKVSTMGNEMGLLGMAFDPGHGNNGFFYVNYTEKIGMSIFSVVARYSVDPNNPDLGDPTSELRLLRYSQPESNHNGGHVRFGPDGFLYVSSGDGGSGGDPHGACGNGQNTGTLLGKILRIDPHPTSAGIPDCGGTSNYSIPADNPFLDGPGGDCDEIWAYGLRNPWRFDIDPQNGDLYVADVGQDCWEEVNHASGGSSGGENFGWRQMEGAHCFDSGDPNCDPGAVACIGSPDCMDPSLELPVLEYAHAGGACSITGGFVYRGCRMPNFDGVYFYGDFCAGFIRSFEIELGVVTNEQDWTDELDPGGQLGFGLTSFGHDARGEIYLVDRDGEILKILPPFTDLEVSGSGAADLFQLGTGGDWTWEDLEFSTMHPVASYRVYRGVPGGIFECVHSTAQAGWPAGDVMNPAPGDLIGYLVTAVSPDEEETLSGDPPGILSIVPCPP